MSPVQAAREACIGAGGVPDAIQRNRELAAFPASRSYWLNFSLDF